MSKRKLTPRQARFVQEYLIDLNASQAAMRAGYSQKTALHQGPRLLAYVGIQEAIQKGQDKRARKLEITADRVLQELALVAFVDIRDYVEMGPNGAVRFKDWSKLPPEASRAVAELVQEVTGVAGEAVKARTRFKLHDKLSALALLAKHLGMAVDRLEHSGPGGGPIETVDVNERAARIRRIVESIEARALGEPWDPGGAEGDRGLPAPVPKANGTHKPD